RRDGKPAWGPRELDALKSKATRGSASICSAVVGEGRLALSYFESFSSDNHGIDLIDLKAGTLKILPIEGPLADHLEYFQHCALYPRGEHFLLTSNQPFGWYIEVRKASDGSLVKR